MSKIGGSACKYIKKSKHCITPCAKVHNSRIKHKWYCKQTRKCFDVKKRHKKRKTAKRKSSPSPSPKTSSQFSSIF